ncbi:MAG TPA: Gfo/Idh/MocA family oxidoreductase [Intrasporangium sp.]|uniref:Gfo/Idh/MocA family protein n=1 Tax=Intrasporangium sp. TaxID=1925024 RepID=UPI002D77D7C1|nr:Gfo/Idh/MocA family oxidoreductase [Intrasporangium sp.]HET7398136.1 Gfo/Idh/MocA family oxidoreductase [Intrasporangium sp.]
MEPLRLGLLGAARITDLAIVKPAKTTGTRLVAVAARDRARAATFAEAHGVEKVHESYLDVINDPDVEAVYNPLANSLHAPWNLAALAAGKHVFTEKPSASNAAEAEAVAAAANGTDRQFFEGFHYLWHPLVERLHAILASGELGELRHVETVMDMPAPDAGDPRWSLELAGGALMDLGCYSLHSMRILAPFAGGEPELVSATGGERQGSPGVDEWLTAELQFPSGVTGTAGCNMASDHHQMSHRLVGTSGEAVIKDFVNPHHDDRLVVTTRTGSRTEHLGRRSSYTYQLEAFTRAVRTGVRARTDATDAVKTMRLIDQCYEAVGLHPRPAHSDAESDHR